MQSWYCWRWCSKMLLPSNCWKTQESRHNGWYGQQRSLCWWWSLSQERYPQLEVPYWEWYRQQLGWYGKNLASCILQRIESCTRRASLITHWSSNESKGKQRKDDKHHVRDIQCPIILCWYLSRPLTLCFRKNNRYCCWFWRWCYTHSPNLWRICTPTRYSQNWLSRKSMHRLAHQNYWRTRNEFHHHCWERNC